MKYIAEIALSGVIGGLIGFGMIQFILIPLLNRYWPNWWR